MVNLLVLRLPKQTNYKQSLKCDCVYPLLESHCQLTAAALLVPERKQIAVRLSCKFTTHFTGETTVHSASAALRRSMVSLPPFRKQKRPSLYFASLTCAFLLFYFAFNNSPKPCSTVQSQQSTSLRAPVSLPEHLVFPIPTVFQPHAPMIADVLHLLTYSAPSKPLNLSTAYNHPSLSPTEKCSIVEYNLPYPFPRISVCIRPYSDLVSNHIRIHRTWLDCNVLIELFNRHRSRYGNIFVDVGSNIGACTFTLLAAGATVIAFEPTPSNLFYLTQTVAINRNAHPDWVNRLIVFPVGLGDEASFSRVYPEPGNAGNAVIGRPVLDNGTDVTSGAGRKMMDDLSFEISIHRLDDFFMNGDVSAG